MTVAAQDTVKATPAARQGLWRRAAETIGRLAVALLFLSSVVAHLANWQDAVVQMPLPLPAFFLAVGLSIEAIGGLLILLGVRVRLAAGLLITFTLIATLLFKIPPRDAEEIQSLLTNIGLVGALLMIAAQPHLDHR